MKKLGFFIAFTALFAVGLSAQTPVPPKKTPTPRPAVTTKPKPAPAPAQTSTTTTSKPAAKNTVARGGGKRHPVKAATTAKPVDASTNRQQKVQ